MEQQNLYTVKYYLATYKGYQKVYAESEYEACEKVKRQMRKLTSLVMYSDGYEVVAMEPIKESEY